MNVPADLIRRNGAAIHLRLAERQVEQALRRSGRDSHRRAARLALAAEGAADVADGAEAGSRGLEHHALGLLPQPQTVEHVGLRETVEHGDRETDRILPVRGRNAILCQGHAATVTASYTPCHR